MTKNENAFDLLVCKCLQYTFSHWSAEKDTGFPLHSQVGSPVTECIHQKKKSMYISFDVLKKMFSFKKIKIESESLCRLDVMVLLSDNEQYIVE